MTGGRGRESGGVDLQRYVLTDILPQSDVENRLSIYGPGARLVDSMEIYGGGIRGVAKVRATGLRFRPILGNNVDLSNPGHGSYTVHIQDTLDHFAEGEGVSITPGIRYPAIARQGIDQALLGGRELVAIRDVQFTGVTEAGVVLSVNCTKEPEIESNGFTFSSSITAGNDVKISKMELEYGEHGPNFNPKLHIAPEYFTESAAQTALVLMQRLGRIDLENELPIFKSIDEIEIMQSIEDGEEVTIDVAFEGENSQFAASAIIKKADGTIAQKIKGMRGSIGKKEVVERFIMAGLARVGAEIKPQ